MKIFNRIILATIGITYMVIFMGGLVRVSGAGLGCPDWPLCFGRIIPPTSLSQLPPDIDPATFNITLAWIEYTNRLVGVLTGFFIILSTFFSFKYYRTRKQVFIPVAASLVLVLVEGWLGSVVVSSFLNPLIITMHMLLALVIISLLVYAWLQAYFIENPPSPVAGTRRWQYTALALWVLIVAEILLGTEMRAGLEEISSALPQLNESDWLSVLPPLKYFHTVLGILVTALAAYLAISIYRGNENYPDVVKPAALGVAVILFVQILLGETMVFFRIPDVVRLFHMWGSSWIVGLSVVLFVGLKKAEVKNG